MDGAENMSAILKRLGLRAAGGNHASLKRACAEFGIELPVVDRAELARKHLGKPAVPLDELLIEGISLNSGNLKKRLLSEGLLKEECAKCGLGPEWQGEPLVFHLDHANGNHLDNRLENLRLLCPNCHSQTPTYAGRSKPRTEARYRSKVEFTQTELQQAVSSSTNWHQVCVALGDISPTAYGLVQAQAEGYGIGSSHFEPSKHTAPKRAWTDDELQTALMGATSWAQVCATLRIAAAGGNYRRLRQRAEELALDISAIRSRRSITG